jgi:hypothetical protein
VKKLLSRAEPAPAVPPAEASTASPLSRFFEGAAESFTKSSPPSAPVLAAPRTISQVPAASGGIRPPAGPVQELQKLRMEVKRLESLVKKLQADLASEREYRATLESQLQTLSTAE